MALRTVPVNITSGLLLGAAPRTNQDGSTKTDRNGQPQFSAEVLLIAATGHELAKVTVTDPGIMRLAEQAANGPVPVTIGGLEVGAYASGAGANFYWSAVTIASSAAPQRKGE